MTNPSECHERLTGVFREVFDDESLKIEDHYAAENIPGWDSLMHINLIIAIEEEFDVKFSTTEIASFRCVGDVKELIVARSKAA